MMQRWFPPYLGAQANNLHTGREKTKWRRTDRNIMIHNLVVPVTAIRPFIDQSEKQAVYYNFEYQPL